MRDLAPRSENPCLKVQRLQELAARLKRTIGVARALVLSGRTLDLSGIDEWIGLLCAQALDLPAEQGRPMIGMLTELLDETDGLAEALRAAKPSRSAG